MVRHLNVHDFRRHEQCVGQFDVLHGRCRIIRRMGMAEDEGTAGFADGGPENFPRVEERPVEDADGYQFVANEAALRV